MMKQVCVLLLLCSVLLVSSQPLTASMPSVWDKQVSFEFKDTPFKEAVDTLFRTAGMNYAYAGAVSDRKLTMVLREVSLGSAFWRILSIGGATADVDKNTVLIRPARPADSVVSELQHKLVESKVQLAVELRTRKEEDPVVQNLRAAIKALEERFAKEYDLAVWAEIVNVDMKNMPLDSALEQLLRGTEINYMVDRDVAALKVAAVLKNVTRETAFREILKASGVVATVSPNGIWRISSAGAWYLWGKSTDLQVKLSELKRQLQTGPAKSPDDKDVLALKAAIAELETKLAEENKRAGETIRLAPRTEPEAGKSQASLTRVFAIKYINPAELPPLVYALGAQQVTVVTGGKLVVRATEEVMSQASEIISELDRETALPRPVRVQIMATYTITDKAGKKEVLKGATEGTLPEGQPISLEIASQPKDASVIQYPLILDLWLTREMEQEDRITLQGKWNLQSLVRVEPSGQLNSLTLSTVPVALSAVTGKPIIIGSGTFGRPGGTVDFEVTAIITYGEGRLRLRTDDKGPNPANQRPPLVHGVPAK